MNRSGLPWCILYSQKLTPSEKLVFMTLKDRAYQQDKTCESGFYCYIDWLCANLNMSENTVRKALNGLRQKKIINSKRVKVHKNVVNMWFIDWTMIDKVSQQFRFKEDDDCTEIDVLEDVVETPIEQIPDVAPDSEDNDDDFRYGEIDTTNPMVAFLREDDEPSIKDRVKENQFNMDIKESAIVMRSLVRLKTPKNNLDEEFTKQAKTISIKYGKQLDYVANEIRRKYKEIISAA